jgi:hypothetical protein
MPDPYHAEFGGPDWSSYPLTQNYRAALKKLERIAMIAKLNADQGSCQRILRVIEERGTREGWG